jgi:hypothetical protein
MKIKSKIQTAINHPEAIGSELNKYYFNRLGTSRYNDGGIKFFDRDWDNLIILDACRYDAFKEKTPDLPGKTKKKTSKGSATKEFVEANFCNKILYDTVYVSANQWYPRLKNSLNSDIFKFIATERDAFNGLTSKPKTVTKKSLECNKEYPHKRFIIHYLLPHQPFFGPTGEKFSNNSEGTRKTVKNSEATKKEFKKAYYENLSIVLDEVEILLNSLEGKTVITSDHGELLGEREKPIPVRTYGHPYGVHIPELINIPWHIYPFDERKMIKSESPSKDEYERDTDKLDQHLSDLGYKI